MEEREVEGGKSGGSSGKGRGRNKKDAEMETVEELLGSETDRQTDGGKWDRPRPSKSQRAGNLSSILGWELRSHILPGAV